MLTLAIMHFDADPAIVTTTLGFEPTMVARKGERSRNGQLRTFNAWWHEVEGERLVDGLQHDNALRGILALLSGREDNFARLRLSINPREVMIYGGLYKLADQQCGVWLEPDQMRMLAACGVGWGLDIFDAD